MLMCVLGCMEQVSVIPVELPCSHKLWIEIAPAMPVHFEGSLAVAVQRLEAKGVAPHHIAELVESARCVCQLLGRWYLSVSNAWAEAWSGGLGIDGQCCATSGTFAPSPGAGRLKTGEEIPSSTQRWLGRCR